MVRQLRHSCAGERPQQYSGRPCARPCVVIPTYVHALTRAAVLAVLDVLLAVWLKHALSLAGVQLTALLWRGVQVT